MLNTPRSTRKRATVQRFAYTPHGTFGRVLLPSGREVVTIEDPPNGNRTGASCIPEGIYDCVPSRFNKGGYPAFMVTDVPGRSLIKGHVANTTHDVRGCIGFALALSFMRGRWAVSSSRQGFARFMAEYGGRDFELEITSFRPDIITEGSDTFRRVLAAAGVGQTPGDPMILPGDTAPMGQVA